MIKEQFEWDASKRLSNLNKHGVDFEDAIEAFAGPTYEKVDDRYDYGETRFVALGEVDGRVLAIVYTIRDDVVRIISARRANQHEQRTYRAALARQAPETG